MHYTAVHEEDGSLQLENHFGNQDCHRESGPPRKTTVSALLDRITADWIESRRGQTDDNAEQMRLHASVQKTIGTICQRKSKACRAIARKRS
jgi:hypothetical protein